MIRIEFFLRGLFYIKYNGLKSSLIVSIITSITCKEIRKRKDIARKTIIFEKNQVYLLKYRIFKLVIMKKC